MHFFLILRKGKNADIECFHMKSNVLNLFVKEFRDYDCYVLSRQVKDKHFAVKIFINNFKRNETILYKILTCLNTQINKEYVAIRTPLILEILERYYKNT